MVRKITTDDITIGDWAAIDAMMARQMHEGTFEETVLDVTWNPDRPALALGVLQDGIEFDVETAEEADFVTGRRYALSGGHMMLVPETPELLFYYQKDDTTIEEESDIHGEATTRALEKLGFDDVTYDFGDFEVEVEGITAKVMASGPASLDQDHPEFRTIAMGIIWEMSADVAGVMDDVFQAPPEKFEDKDTDSLTGRVRPLSDLLKDVGLEISQQELIDQIIEENVKSVMGENRRIEEGKFSEEERDFIDRMAPFFESDVWINRVSTADLCEAAPEGAKIGVAAYKSRKLLKASLVLDDGLIQDALYTGDMYLNPQPSVRGRDGLLEDLAKTILGLDPLDEDALEDAIANTLDDPAVDLPQMTVDDFVAPVVRAAENRMPVSEYREEYL